MDKTHHNILPGQKKAILQTNLWPRLARCSIHLVPIGATAAILLLTLRQIYWTDPSAPYTQTKLQALQFAGKLYEAFICASLASAVLQVLRRDLLGEHGIALGHLISAFTFTEVTTILSSRFWFGFGCRRKHRSSMLMLGLLTISILLAAAAGPSAAIAVIPRLGWWPQTHVFEVFNYFGDRPQYTIHVSSTSLWPSSLDASHFPNSNCTQSYNLQDIVCPGKGYETLLDLSLYWKNNRGGDGFARPSALEPLNLSVPQTSLAEKPFSQPLTAALECFADTEQGLQYGTVASTSSLVLAASLWNILQRGGSLIQLEWERAIVQLESVGLGRPVRPFVQVKCVDVMQETDFNQTRTIHFPNYGLLTPGFSMDQANAWGYVCETWDNAPNLYKEQHFDVPETKLQDSSELKQHIEGDTSYLRWINLGDGRVGPSIGAAVYLPQCNISTPAIYACSVDARWLPTSIWIEPTADSSIHGTRAGYRDLLRSMAGEDVPLELVHIGLDWANTLNTRLPLDRNMTTIESILNKVLLDPTSRCSGVNGDYGIPIQALEASLGLVIVDGLSRVGLGYNYSITPTGSSGLASGTVIYNSSSSKGIWDFPVDELSNMPNWSNITFSFRRYGYGYGFGTVTTSIAIAVLLLHAVKALWAITFVLFRREVCHKWGDYGQMFVLALTSKPPRKLENAGSGSSKLSTWNQQVVARVERGCDKVELIFKDEDDELEYDVVQRNVRRQIRLSVE